MSPQKFNFGIFCRTCLWDRYETNSFKVLKCTLPSEYRKPNEHAEI